MNDKRKSLLGKIAAVLAAAVIVVLVAFVVYVSIYYHADAAVEEYLASGGTATSAGSTATSGVDATSGEAESAVGASSTSGVSEAESAVGASSTSGVEKRVEKTDYGWFLDGPSEENALIFYPGAKVDEKAYIPLMYQFAAAGMDVCLVKMPFRLAFFGMDKATDVMSQYEYKNWYIGGHSLGGAMGASYAASHGDALRGVVLLAAYATEKLDDDLVEIVIYGSEDQVLRDGKIEEGREFAPGRYFEYVIEGGNHAQFGNYGEQKGDGKALISAEEQQAETVEFVMENLE